MKVSKIKILDKTIAYQIQKDCFSHDKELNHSKADDLLIDLLEQLDMRKTARIYEKATRNSWHA